MLKKATPPLCDTHCHLTAHEIPGGPQAAAQRAANKGVTHIVVVESVPGSWEATTAMCASRPALLPACGLHPCFLPGKFDLQGRFAALRDLAPSLSAIGETGLDGNSPDMELQKLVFAEHLKLAADFGKPVLVHCRRAFPELLEIWRRFAPQITGVMHCYSGSAEQLGPFIDAGFYASFGGPVTFEGAKKPIKAMKATPLDKLLLETDSPDLTPVPWRGLPNEPAFLPAIAEVACAVLEIPLCELCKETFENSARLFRF